MSADLSLVNARIVLADRVIEGALEVCGGMIASIDEGRAEGTVDCGGDLIVPGLIEVHTDNLERHVSPRPGVHWPMRAAIMAHDAQVAASGITTVLDALAVGDLHENSVRTLFLGEMSDGLANATAEDVLRVEHFLHLRAELSHGNMIDGVERLIDNPRVRAVSLMDHTPGQRQFADETAYRLYYKGRFGFSEAEMDAWIAKHKESQRRHAGVNRKRVLELARARSVALGSHDDATPDHIREAAEDRMSFTEFPTTEAAAVEARLQGIDILLGAPNVVRGKSHSGNASALDLARVGLLDILSSDYVPSSLMYAVVILHRMAGLSLPRAVATATRNPARLLGLDDRGEIAIGRRADLVRVNDGGEVPVIRTVWRAGERVA